MPSHKEAANEQTPEFNVSKLAPYSSLPSQNDLQSACAFKNNSVLYCLTSVRKIEIIQNERTLVHFTPLRKTTTRLILGRS